jgi:replicative DNA helicase
MDIVKDAEQRIDEIIRFNKQQRIPTGFKEVDKVMYGGLSTVEELLLIIARTNTGKSWICTKMMESAQKNGFPVLYYSPEMQSSFIGTRFDTWRGHFKNSDLHKGNYNEDYRQYIKNLVNEETGAIVVEDKDMSGGRTTVRGLEQLVKKNKIKLLIIDGLSYISEGGYKTDTDVVRYKNICNDLFRLSKTYGCAVVVSVQANRATKENNDDKGEPFPTIYNVEGSDHPARIATQVFSLRQIHDTHTMEIRLEKSRNAKNDKPVFSYVWDPNTGTTSLIADNNNDETSSQEFHTPVITPNVNVEIEENATDVEYDEDITF